MSYIDEFGEYHEGEGEHRLRGDSSQHKAWSHDRQRAEHQWELLQPYDRNGRPDSAFMEAFPEESKVNEMRWEDRDH